MNLAKVEAPNSINNLIPPLHICFKVSRYKFQAKNYTVYGVYCDLLFETMQCYKYLMFVFFTNHGQTSCLDTIEHSTALLDKK